MVGGAALVNHCTAPVSKSQTCSCGKKQRYTCRSERRDEGTCSREFPLSRFCFVLFLSPDSWHEWRRGLVAPSSTFHNRVEFPHQLCLSFKPMRIKSFLSNSSAPHRIIGWSKHALDLLSSHEIHYNTDWVPGTKLLLWQTPRMQWEQEEQFPHKRSHRQLQTRVKQYLLLLKIWKLWGAVLEGKKSIGEEEASDQHRLLKSPWRALAHDLAV